jgi:hypothetical protein
MHDAQRLTVDEALARLGAHLGQSGFQLSEDGTIGFSFANDVSCTIEAPRDSDFLHVHAPVTRVPPHGREAFLERLLSHNLFRLGMPGAWLALDGDEVLLCAAVDGAAFEPDMLPGLLLALTSEVGDLRRALAALDEAARGDDSFIPGSVIRG